MASQFFLKTSQDVELFTGYPEFNQYNNDNLIKDSSIISSVLSPCGRFLAISTSDKVKVFTGERFETLLTIFNINNVYDLKFSPSGNFLGTWERASINDPNHKNVKIWYLNKLFNNDNENTEPESQPESPSYEYQYKSQNSWFLQFSKLDNYALKLFGKELRIVKIDYNSIEIDFEKPFAKLLQESDQQMFSTYLISPSEHPTICTFTPEKSGKPAHLTIWPIMEGTITKRIATKTFFKADSCQLKWNQLGNAVLCIATTDFDSSNQSYYGENTLYLLSFQGVNGSLGGNSVRVPLNKEGPIHDVTWSPTSRQFGVIYGFMPATITFFDLRGNIVHSLPEQPKNTMIFSPSGRYILIAGFGNLQGAVEILDRHDKFKCITKFNAANTSVCKWSPGGEFIMTATTSPRLRVDNGVKIWHVTGKLVFIKEFKELLKIDWRETCNYKTLTIDGKATHIIKDWQPISETLAAEDPKITNKSNLSIHSCVNEYELKYPNKKEGANGNSSATKPAGAYKPPHARRAEANGTRKVPGMTIVNAKQKTNTVPGIPGMAPKESKTAAKNRKKRNNKTKQEDSEIKETSAEPGTENKEPVANKETSPEEKKIRSLLKKLRAIETLKQRQAVGDKLEDTQVLKIQTEDKVLNDLKLLGWSE
ncbi:hypothetical protein Kpol_543p34 [Vanderwaltozyma polyspora DSM 70294]|uniref:Eukaryotic translation initiation factor 2A n=1 Tax=Vanderwaltozyma polyspora (strain ATCC 22028 / DSM 70294 / BCRC 21397 / CBS 2163 / NBRC 10782 / NRRL Y-8283 / UCD 57-17) TaxID=436907 RepID=A7THN8_VANPO|nr:uncharacterized protein Kpol_543p34 [Vanderwaltozyma polyspora DSM 70294]EDO18204.1 hypothetical protein Kpol_543p34 [Vanderwaltozyma polyspora DSM 70294]